MKEGFSKISRKDFLSRMGWLLSLPILVIGGLSISRQSQLLKDRKVLIPYDIEDGVSFIEDIIIVKNNNEIKFLASACPHLGCKINKTENDLLICPCHGSQFKLDGANTKGPATQDLKILPFELDEMNKNYIVKNS
jgi:Rieske Fe-S protein